MKDLAIVLLLSLSVATMVTAHLATVVGLVSRPPRWRALLALLVPPLAALFAYREKMRLRAGCFLGGAGVYAVTLLVASGDGVLK